MSSHSACASATPPAVPDDRDRAVLHDAVRGVLVGAALGDALGVRTEFLSKKDAQRACSAGPLELAGWPRKSGHWTSWEEGDWTDDTDQVRRESSGGGRVHSPRLGPTDLLSLIITRIWTPACLAYAVAHLHWRRPRPSGLRETAVGVGDARSWICSLQRHDVPRLWQHHQDGPHAPAPDSLQSTGARG